MPDRQHPEPSEATPPFGTYAPTRWQARLIAWTRGLSPTWLGKRTAFFLRRLMITFLRHPLDVEVFGQRMRLHPFSNNPEKQILFTPQFFDAAERAKLADRITDDMVFIDVGANVGAYALFVAGRAGPNARILAVEPLPTVFDRLVSNIALNPGLPIKAVACALADRDGDMTLFVDARNSGESSIKVLGWAGESGQSLQVPARTLLGLVEDEGLERIDAIKLDAEGAEDLILVPFLRDAPAHLLPRLVIIENVMGRWQTDCIALLKQMGYRMVVRTRLNAVLERDATPSTKSSGRDTTISEGETSQP